MSRIALLIVLVIPTMAPGEVWRWRDVSGQLHYSNVPSRVPARAAAVHGDVGYISPAAQPLVGETTSSTALDRLREERAIKRRLGEIEAFYARVRARQLARLQAYATSTLLPDWIVADRWLQLKDEEGRLRADLARLERRREPRS